MEQIRRFFPCLGVLSLAALVLAQGGGGGGMPFPDVTLAVRDYSGNVQATDRVWFYTNDNGSQNIYGGGNTPLLSMT